MMAPFDGIASNHSAGWADNIPLCPSGIGCHVGFRLFVPARFMIPCFYYSLPVLKMYMPTR